jgi:AcrR family transcriptional regulator
MSRPSRKADILTAATRCFADLGYGDTRIRHIAQRAGVSEAAIYRHFDSLDALAQEVYAEHFADYAQLVLRCVTPDQQAEQKLRAVVRATLTRYREDRHAFVATLIRLPNFMPHLPPGTVYPLELIEQAIVEGQATGTVREGQPNLLASIFLGALLRPFLLADLATPGAFELQNDTRHDHTIEDACIAALFTPSTPKDGS